MHLSSKKIVSTKSKAIVIAAVFGVFFTLLFLFNAKAPSEPQLNNPVSTPKIACFLKKGPCNYFKDITDQKGRYFGIGTKAESNSEIIAAFDGQVITYKTILPFSASDGGLNTINIDNPGHGSKAIYLFKGEVTNLESVRQGDVIGKITGNIDSLNVSLIFQLLRGERFRENVKLSTDNFVD